MSTETQQEIEQLAAATIKGLAMDAVEKAKSGHPGMPMGMADLAVVLWGRFLVVDPDHPDWVDRDRFVLSNGHGSMLLYSLLHLCGFPLSLDDLSNFRQWDSPTPGHPERDQMRGVEVTTGPLGQGFGMGVGLAIAEEHLRDRFGEGLIDHRTYGFVSDGDLMEGISAETSSLAGHLGLGKLIYFYDHNQITIDGSTELTFTEQVSQRFGAVGWTVAEIDGHDRAQIAQATQAAIDQEDRPSLIISHTHIAAGAPNAQDTAAAHGAPLGAEEITATKQALGIPELQKFWVPLGAVDYFQNAMERGRQAYRTWQQRQTDCFAADPEIAERWQLQFPPRRYQLEGPSFQSGEKLATRSASGKLFPELGQKVPGLIGGSADLVGSTKTHIPGERYFSRENRRSRNLAFGVREHAMGAIVNGLAAHSGLHPYGSTFLVFSDYMRPAIRLSALMETPSIWVFTHDSIWLGEDGPTHQPIEHIQSLRLIPNLWVLRPADAHETVAAWEIALNRTDGPSALLLTRQGVPVLADNRTQANRGGYVVRPTSNEQVVLVATGSEVTVALAAAELLSAQGIEARVVSLPCWELFFAQDGMYQSQVLGERIPRVSLEAGVTGGWERVVGDSGLKIGIDRFGASAPGAVVAEQLGISPDSVAYRVQSWLNEIGGGRSG